MLNILKTEEYSTRTIANVEEGSWVVMSNPRNEEVAYISESCNIDLKDIRSALDRDEISRIEEEDDYTLLIVDIPSISIKSQKSVYRTIPLSIIYTEKNIITVCLEDSPVFKRLQNATNLYTFKRTQLIYRILLNNAKLYMEYLIKINAMRGAIEEKVSTKETLEELYELERCLVYFKTSLRSNELVLNRLVKLKNITKYEEDEELFEDVIIEYRQALEMTQIYYDILHNTISKYNALMDYELNNAMKLLTSITIVLAIPTVVSGFFGMNVINMPFGNSPVGFWSIFVLTFVICCVALLLLKKKKML